MSYDEIVKTIRRRNTISVSTFRLLGLLEMVGIKRAQYIHLGDVEDFIIRIKGK